MAVDTRIKFDTKLLLEISRVDVMDEQRNKFRRSPLFKPHTWTPKLQEIVHPPPDPASCCIGCAFVRRNYENLYTMPKL